MNQTPVKVRRKFDEIFKREAVQNWLQSGKSAETIAGELGLSANLLYAWKKLFAPDAAGGGRRSEQSPAPTPICNRSWMRSGANWPACANSATF
jgi:transposase-like protein